MWPHVLAMCIHKRKRSLQFHLALVARAPDSSHYTDTLPVFLPMTCGRSEGVRGGE